MQLKWLHLETATQHGHSLVQVLCIATGSGSMSSPATGEREGWLIVRKGLERKGFSFVEVSTVNVGEVCMVVKSTVIGRVGQT